MKYINQKYTKMAKARKSGKPKRNRANLVKRLRTIEKNQEILNKFYKELSNS